MLQLLPLWYLVSLALLFGFSRGNCNTTPFCDAYPACTRECLGGEKDNNKSFFHSYGFDMTKICSTGDSGGTLANHYAAVFSCINTNCTSSADGQAAWNQLVDDCGARGYIVDSQLKPLNYSVHGEVILVFLVEPAANLPAQSPRQLRHYQCRQSQAPPIYQD
jgi:hypothetical protein